MTISGHAIGANCRAVSEDNRGSATFAVGLALTLFGVCMLVIVNALLRTAVQPAFGWIALTLLIVASLILIRRGSNAAIINSVETNSHRRIRFEQMSRMLAGEALLDVEITGHIRSWTPAVEKLTGLAPNQLWGMHLSKLLLEKSENSSAIRVGMQRAVATGRSEQEIALRSNRNKSATPDRITFCAVRDDYNKLDAFIAIIRKSSPMRIRDSVTSSSPATHEPVMAPSNELVSLVDSGF